MKREMRRNESGEGEQGETTDRMMKRVTGRARESEKEKDGQMNRGEERDGGQQTIDICSPTGNTRRCSNSK